MTESPKINEKSLRLLPIHKNLKYLKECCDLINEEWKRSETARLHSLESSCDSLPTSLILVSEEAVIGHCKLTKIPAITNACFLESVVIKKSFRGMGFGKYFVLNVEQYCRSVLDLNYLYLSTRGQEGFYSKLGFVECQPISIYGSFKSEPIKIQNEIKTCKSLEESVCNNGGAPIPPPPLPNLIYTKNVPKTFMYKPLGIN